MEDICFNFINKTLTTKNIQIILVTSSQPRKDIFSRTGLPFISCSHGYDENLNFDEFDSSFSQYVQEISRLKLLDYLNKQHETKSFSIEKGKNYIVITADTLIMQNGCILGKPLDQSKAKQMLEMLQGKTHNVCTGVSIKLVPGDDQMIDRDISSFSIESYVTMKTLTEQDIDNYISTGEPLYAIQGLGQNLIEKVSGSVDNVIGLPLQEILERLSLIIRNAFSN